MSRPIIEKYEDEKFYIGLEYQPPDLNSGETITNAEISATPSGLTLDGDPVISNKIVKQMISGGEVNSNYSVEFKTTTSVGNTFIDYIVVKIIF